MRIGMQGADFGNVACSEVRAAARFAAVTIAPEPGLVKPPIERSYGLIEIDLPTGARLRIARINDHNIRKLDQLLSWNWKTDRAKLAA